MKISLLIILTAGLVPLQGIATQVFTVKPTTGTEEIWLKENNLLPAAPIEPDTAGLIFTGPVSVLTSHAYNRQIARRPLSLPGIDYLKRSKRQKTVACILLATGGALIVTGIAVAYSEPNNAINAALSLIFLTGPGIVASLVSIPFFAASSKNRRKAMAFTSSVELLSVSGLAAATPAPNQYPALSLKLSL
ncbi:MAG: hypothetical protein ABW007_12210 [Chitinophagaceae bacterium]